MISTFDIISLIIILLSTLLGVYRGAIYIIIHFMGFILSIVSTIFLYPHVKILILDYIQNQMVVNIISAFLAYIVSLVIFTLIISRITLLFNFINRSFSNRFLGGVIGIIRAILLIFIFFLIIITTFYATNEVSNNKETESSKSQNDSFYKLINDMDFKNYPEFIKNSVISSYLDFTFKKIIKLLPKDAFDYLKIPTRTNNDIIDKDDEDS